MGWRGAEWACLYHPTDIREPLPRPAARRPRSAPSRSARPGVLSVHFMPAGFSALVFNRTDRGDQSFWSGTARHCPRRLALVGIGSALQRGSGFAPAGGNFFAKVAAEIPPSLYRCASFVTARKGAGGGRSRQISRWAGRRAAPWLAWVPAVLGPFEHRANWQTGVMARYRRHGDADFAPPASFYPAA